MYARGPLFPAVAGCSLLALSAGAGSVHAAALEQTVPATIRLLSQEGRYVEFNVAFTSPHQDGSGVTIPDNPLGIPPGTYPGSTGNMLNDRWTFSGAWKDDITDRLSYALIVDQPLMADTSFGQGSFPFPFSLYGGSSADLKTYQFTAALAYEVTPNVTLYGGARAQQLDASASLSFVFDYSVEAEKKWGFGYLVGASYQIPEYALRVALTYYSKISYDLDTTESSLLTGIDQTSTDVDTPQSVSLEFQTGINPKTLVFGSVRWVDWSEFEISPPDYEVNIQTLIGQSRPLVDYDDDWWTYTLGVGRQLTDKLAGSLSISWEPSVGGEMTTLGPYDGRTVGTAALTYEMDRFEITGGVSYGVLGDTYNVLRTDFDDGQVWGAGLRIGYTF
jgi:long-chain fatty acid transport protein